MGFHIRNSIVLLPEGRQISSEEALRNDGLTMTQFMRELVFGPCFRTLDVRQTIVARSIK